MNKYKLKEICTLITDGEHGSVNDDNNSSLYLLSAKNLIDGRVVINNNDRKISYDSFKRIMKRVQLQKNSILISTVGKIGKCAIVEQANINYVFQRSVGIINCDETKCYPKFLYFYFNLPIVKKFINKKTSGSVQKCLFLGDLEQIDLFLPEYSEQKIIGDLVYKIQSRIINNNEINYKLQEMAKTLYDYWFTQFDFPDKNGKPYKSSGGKMVYNEQLKREIPQGWEVKNIKDICNITWGQCPNGDNILPLDYNGEDAILYCSGAGDMRNGLIVDCQAKTNSSRRYANKNDILMSIAGSIGAIAICDKKISLGRAAVGFTPQQNKESFTYELILTFLDRMKAISSGSIQKVVNSNHLNDMNFAFSNELISNFSKYNSILKKQIQISKANQELTSLRSFLLPLLMNGQARICDKVLSMSINEDVTILQNIIKDNIYYSQRFDMWLSSCGLAARGDVDKATLREIFDAMDEDDK